MWLLFQLLVMFAVLSANIYWELTPNGYLASGIALGVAFGLTWLINWLLYLIRRRKHGLQEQGPTLTF